MRSIHLYEYVKDINQNVQSVSVNLYDLFSIFFKQICVLCVCVRTFAPFLRILQETFAL